jgi:hypothetical protein
MCPFQARGLCTCSRDAPRRSTSKPPRCPSFSSGFRPTSQRQSASACPPNNRGGPRGGSFFAMYMVERCLQGSGTFVHARAPCTRCPHTACAARHAGTCTAFAQRSPRSGPLSRPCRARAMLAGLPYSSNLPEANQAPHSCALRPECISACDPRAPQDHAQDMPRGPSSFEPTLPPWVICSGARPLAPPPLPAACDPSPRPTILGPGLTPRPTAMHRRPLSHHAHEATSSCGMIMRFYRQLTYVIGCHLPPGRK